MRRKDFYLLLDELMELDSGTIKGDEALIQFSSWDSLAIIGFIALLDQHFGMSVGGAKIMNCRNVSDLAVLVGDKLKE